MLTREIKIHERSVVTNRPSLHNEHVSDPGTLAKLSTSASLGSSPILQVPREHKVPYGVSFVRLTG